MTDLYKYYAFISYKREDEEWAKWLQHEFEHYHLPATLNGQENLPKEFRPIFRDVDELSAGNLPKQIYEALKSSAYLVVVCSPYAAKSKWVNKEILDFIAIGKEKGIDNVENIFPFIVDGIPHSVDPEKECFPEALRGLEGVKERIGGNINESGRDKAFVKTIAGTMNIGFDTLWNRYEREKIEEEKRRREQRDKLLIMQSRFLAEKVIDLAKTDSLLARLLALEILPKDLNDPDERPYCIEAETALRVACQYSSAILKGAKARFSPDGSKIVAICDNDTINIYDSSSGGCLKTLQGHTATIRTAMFSNDGNKIISAADDMTIRIWDAGTGSLEKTIYTGHTSRIFSVKLTHDDKRIISVSNDKNLKIWDAQTGELITSYDIVESNDAQLDPDDSKVILACLNFEYRIYDLNTGKLLVTSPNAHPESLTSASFSPDGKYVVSTTFNFTNLIKIWDADTGECLHTLEGHKDTVYSAEFSSDGKRLVTASRDNTIRIWDVKSGEQIGEPLVGHTDQVLFAMFSPDGKRILSSSADGSVRIWDINPYRYITSARARTIPFPIITQIGDLCISKERNKLIIEDNSDGKEDRLTIQGHTQVINSVSFSPDGRYVVTASDDHTAKVWDVHTGKQVGPTLEHFEEVYSARFSNDGTWISTETKNDYVMAWDWRPLQQLIEETRELLKNREFTDEERQKYYLD